MAAARVDRDIEVMEMEKTVLSRVVLVARGMGIGKRAAVEI